MSDIVQFRNNISFTSFKQLNMTKIKLNGLTKKVLGSYNITFFFIDCVSPLWTIKCKYTITK